MGNIKSCFPQSCIDSDFPQSKKCRQFLESPTDLQHEDSSCQIGLLSKVDTGLSVFAEVSRSHLTVGTQEHLTVDTVCLMETDPDADSITPNSEAPRGVEKQSRSTERVSINDSPPVIDFSEDDTPIVFGSKFEGTDCDYVDRAMPPPRSLNPEPECQSPTS